MIFKAFQSVVDTRLSESFSEQINKWIEEQEALGRQVVDKSIHVTASEVFLA